MENLQENASYWINCFWVNRVGLLVVVLVVSGRKNLALQGGVGEIFRQAAVGYRLSQALLPQNTCEAPQGFPASAWAICVLCSR